jgi:quercetin dioxygenase-like cupin family protein
MQKALTARCCALAAGCGSRRGLTQVKGGGAPAWQSVAMKEKPMIDAGEAKVVSLADETKFAANGIVSRTLLNTANARVILFGFAEGQELSEHTSTQHAVVQIVSGECEFSLDGQWHTLKAGSLLHMPPNLRHAVQAKKPFSMLLTLIKPAAAAKPAGEGDGHC